MINLNKFLQIFQNPLENKKKIGGFFKELPEDFIVQEEFNEASENEEGPFTHLVIKCKGLEKIHLRSQFAKILSIPVRKIVFAGLKDKQAITTQRISIRAPLEDCERLTSIKNLEILEMKRAMNPLKIGRLKGNRFEITIKNTNIEGEELKRSISEALKQINETGIINYFGSQRMGTNNQNVKIGCLLKKRKFLDALYLIIDSSLRGSWDRKDVEDLNGMYPRYAYLAFKKYSDEGDAFKSLKLIPRSLMKMYRSAYESDLFNKRIFHKYSSKFYCPYDEFHNTRLEEKVKVTRKNQDFFLKKVQNREGSYVMRVGKKSSRPIIFYLEEIKLIYVNEREYRVSFRLPKGCYATEVIDKLINAPVVY